MKKPSALAAAAVSSAIATALLLSGCTSTPAPQTGSPFRSGPASASSSAPAQGSALPQSNGPIDSVTATVTVTSTDSPSTGTSPTGGADSTTASVTVPTMTVEPSTSAPLNYDTTIAPPPTPIGAGGTQTSSTETMATVTPTALPGAPFVGITTPTRIPRPADTGRTDPVQLAAAFVSLIEAPKSTDSRADNATLRATPFATPELSERLSALSVAPSDVQPPVGYVQVTVRSAVITNAAPAGAAAKKVTVAVIYDRLTIITATSNYNGQRLLIRLCTLDKGADGKWTVSGYSHGAN